MLWAACGPRRARSRRSLCLHEPRAPEPREKPGTSAKRPAASMRPWILGALPQVINELLVADDTGHDWARVDADAECQLSAAELTPLELVDLLNEVFQASTAWSKTTTWRRSRRSATATWSPSWPPWAKTRLRRRKGCWPPCTVRRSCADFMSRAKLTSALARRACREQGPIT